MEKTTKKNKVGMLTKIKRTNAIISFLITILTTALFSKYGFELLNSEYNKILPYAIFIIVGLYLIFNTIILIRTLSNKYTKEEKKNAKKIKKIYKIITRTLKLTIALLSISTIFNIGGIQSVLNNSSKVLNIIWLIVQIVFDTYVYIIKKFFNNFKKKLFKKKEVKVEEDDSIE